MRNNTKEIVIKVICILVFIPLVLQLLMSTVIQGLNAGLGYDIVPGGSGKIVLWVYFIMFVWISRIIYMNIFKSKVDKIIQDKKREKEKEKEKKAIIEELGEDLIFDYISRDNSFINKVVRPLEKRLTREKGLDYNEVVERDYQDITQEYFEWKKENKSKIVDEWMYKIHNPNIIEIYYNHLKQLEESFVEPTIIQPKQTQEQPKIQTPNQPTREASQIPKPQKPKQLVKQTTNPYESNVDNLATDYEEKWQKQLKEEAKRNIDELELTPYNQTLKGKSQANTLELNTQYQKLNIKKRDLK